MEARAGTGAGQADDREVVRAATELRERFVGAGCVARTPEYASLLPGFPCAQVEEALHRIAQEGGAQVWWLADGTFAFFFPR